MTEIWLITRRTSTMFLIITSVISMSPLESSGFQLTTKKMKYDDARSYCRNMNIDVATVYNLAEVNIMLSLVLPTGSNIWIGLEVGDLWIWHWTGSDQGTSFLNWDTGEPQDNEQKACAVMNQNGKWLGNDCGTPESFVCQGIGDVSTYIFVEVKKSWRDARSHCWNLSSDLVTIHSAEENKAVRNISTSERLWIGLFKDPWTWSGGSNSSFRFWDANEPNYGSNGNCVTADLGNNGKWSTQNCNNRHSVICGTATNPTTTSLQTTQSITTYPASTNMETPPLHAGATIFNSTLVSTEQQITNATTTEPSTISGLTSYTTHTMTTPPPQNVTTAVPSTTTTSNMTEVISHPITTESNNTNTKIPTMAPIQPLQNITTPAPSTVTGLTTSTHTEVVSHPTITELDNTSTEIPTVTPTPLHQNNTKPAPTTGTRPTTSTATEFVSHPPITELTSTNKEMATMTSPEMPENATNPSPRTVTGPTTFNTTEVGTHPITPELNNASTEMSTMTTTPLQQNNVTEGLSTITELISSNTTEVVSHPTITEFNNTSTEMPTMSTTQPSQNVTTPTATTGTGPNLSNTTEVVSHPTTTELNKTSTEMPTMSTTQPSQNVTTPTPTTGTGPNLSNTTEVVSHPTITEFNNTNTEMPTMSTTQPSQNVTTPTPTTGTGPNLSNTTEIVSHPTTTELNKTSTEMPTMTLTPLLQNVSTPTPSTATGLTTSDSTEVVSHPITSNLNSTNTEMPTMTSTATAPPQNLTTPAPLTEAGPTALNTTEVVSHPPIPQLNSTEVTPKQPPQNTTVNVITNSVFTPTAQTGTSFQTTTQSPAPISTVSSFYSDGLILIQKNMTWISALSFCREHYVDLVQITSEAIQDKVAEKARSSTSPHVWLGLRYTCNFNFWFWTSSTAGCYQNWQPGEGPERATQCGESAAIKSTGRQQWVSLPETQELNFICQTCGN
ncbi:PREDICTED: cell wall protein DAN4-like isoform X1 [Poecilia mexicana]|uniref:cell wall protein DAN4-like isoform X1 n=1 Tax=Poecilia mexicana TaxID=48701 RepID=UPI00072E13DE|nr:PREDICTED: cell wall protein DAN4-like isoform X1 [Poecilia mexicana]